MKEMGGLKTHRVVHIRVATKFRNRSLFRVTLLRNFRVLVA
jgi:hypothetical protein